MIYLVPSLNAQLTTTIDKDHLDGNGTITIVGGFATIDGTADLNWDTGQLTMNGDTNLLDGAITGNLDFSADTQLDITAEGTATVGIPTGIPGIGGTTLASGNVYFQFRNSAKGIDWVSEPQAWTAAQQWSDDYVVGWGTLNLGLLGSPTVGFIQRFDGSWPQPVGASQIQTLTGDIAQQGGSIVPCGAGRPVRDVFHRILGRAMAHAVGELG